MSNSLETWAVPRLQQLLPLDDESVKQIVHYTDTLPKDAAAEHLKNMLGDEPKALEFISSFNMRRQNAPASSLPQAQATNHERPQAPATPASGSGVPRASMRGRGGKKRANIHALPARQVEGHGTVPGSAYQKRNEDDYMPRAERQNQTHKELISDNLALRERPPDATKMPLITDDASATSKPITSKPPPSAAGPLVSDSLSSRKAASARTSRNASPAPKTKVSITGGTAMHGASTALSDLDSAIQSLEIQTNPSLSLSEAENEKRKCSCMATRHPLLDIAPNCKNCGMIICVKQGLGPCTFCGTPLLSGDEISKVLRVLKDERGEEKMKANNAAHRKADVSHGKARAFTGRDFLTQASSARSSPLSSAPATPVGSDDEASTQAKAHRDKLLGFQANNARRTQIHDEAADFDIPTAGTNMWASPAERAQQLKRQQKVLREQEWAARPEYEKRKVVASIDLKGGKIVRRMADVEKPDFSAADDEAEMEDYQPPARETGAQGAFSNNPLAAGLIRPRAREEKGKDATREKPTTWRRVQMDEDDNEGWILDGGVYGGRIPEDRVLGQEEHAFG